MHDSNEKKLWSLLKKIKTANKVKQTSIAMSILPLAACGGGSGTPSTNTSQPQSPSPDPDFIESPTNVFIALDNLNRTLSEGGSTQNLTVTGKSGNDSITTGSGADVIISAAGNDIIISNGGDDLIRGGDGLDTISAGGGNDAIVIVGTTEANEYSLSAITNSGGSGIDLSRLVNLADLNGRSVSEVLDGEIIDGGSGTNTLFIYGTVDLTGVTLNNITVLVVNSDVTLTPEQIASFTTIDGDGNSVINIEVPAGSSDSYFLDLSTINLTDVGSIIIDGDITIVIDDVEDISGVGEITSGAGDILTLEVKGSGENTILNLEDIANIFDQVDIIELSDNVTIIVDDATDVTGLGLSEITGSGEIDSSGTPAVETALDTVTIAPNVNSAPVTVNDIADAGENQAISIDVLGNDTDADNDVLTLSNLTIGSNQGSVSIVDNKINFDPGTDFDDLATGATEEVTIEYTVSDGNSSDQGTLTITVTGVADEPVAVDDTADAGENEIILVDVLANDINADETLEITSYSGVSEGSDLLSVVNGKIQFDPGTAFDSLATDATEDVIVNYTITNSEGSDQGTLTITVTGVADEPVAVDDTADAGENEIILVDVLANDTHDVGELIINSYSGVSEGSDTLSVVNGKIQFDPKSMFDYLATGETQVVTVNYTVSDNNGSDDGSLTITVTGAADAPVAVDDIAIMSENDILLADVLNNDLNDNSELEITSVSGITIGDGTLSVVNGKIEFDPGTETDQLETGQSKDLYINYTVSNSTGSDEGTLKVTVNGASDDPIAVSDTAEVFTNAVAHIDVLANDSDANGELEIFSVWGISEGSDVLSVVNGKIEFDPGATYNYLNAGETEYITVLYTVSNSDGSDFGTLNIIVNGIVGGPVAINDTASLYENEVILVDILGNDGSSGGDLTITSIDAISASTGTLSVVGSKIQFEPGAYFDALDFGQTGTLDVNYTVTDDNGSDTGTITFTVNGIGNNPIAINDTYTSFENEIISVDVLANDIDLEGDLQITSLSGVSDVGGTLSVVNSKIQFDPGTDFDDLMTGETEQFTIYYDVYNGSGYDTGELYMTVIGINEDVTSGFIEVSTDNYNAINDLSSIYDGSVEVVNLTINGKSGDETITSGSGDDLINSGAGLDIINTSSGNDTIIYNSGDTINGGTDSDTLQIDGADLNIDLSTIAMINMEIVDLTGSGDNSATLTLQDVLDVTDSGNQLIIYGNSGDSVTSTGEGWIQGTDQVINLEIYNTYTSGSGTLIIDEDVTQTIN